MKTTIFITMSLIVLSTCQAVGQALNPSGCYVLVSNDTEEYSTTHSQKCYTRIPSHPVDLEQSGEFLCFREGRVEVLLNFYAVHSKENEILAGGGEYGYDIRILPLARGIRLLLADQSCKWSYCFTTSGDTLCLNSLFQGILPLDFQRKSEKLTDTLGLLVLLPSIACLQKTGKGTLTIHIDDPETTGGRKKDLRLAAKRLAVLQALLRRGLGDAYMHIQFEDRNPTRNATRYEASYRLH
jgi:hypothetical protein